MEGKDSFDSEKFFPDYESENGDTKARTSNNEKEEEGEEEVENEIRNLDLIKTISHILETILNDNKLLDNYAEIVKNQRKMAFSSRIIPSISIEEYLIRIQTYANMEKNTLILSLIYIDRLCKIASITLTYYNIHRILFISILVSIKYNEDQYYDNKYYAEIAGVKLKELNTLEYNFLNKTKFLLFVNDEKFKKYKLYLDNFNQ
jgi:hypothetical protein